MRTRLTLLMICCLILSGCGCAIFGRDYPRITFDLHVTGPDFSETRYLSLDVEASHLRYHEVNSTIQPEQHYYLRSSSGVRMDRWGTTPRPPIIGELSMVLHSNIVSRTGSAFVLRDTDLLSASYREFTFDKSHKEVTIFDGTLATNLSLSIDDLSFICDRKGFTATPERDGKELDRFRGTLICSFVDKNSSRSRHLNGKFRLKWKRESRSS